MREARAVAPLLAPLESPESYAERMMQARPALWGVLTWPYVTSTWTPARRVQHLAAHFACVGAIPALAVGAEEVRRLVPLDDVVPGAALVLDQAPWFMREGPLVLNLFVDDERVYSLAFSLVREGGRLVAWIGAIQGRSPDATLRCSVGSDALTVYRELTRSLDGMRPADFLVEAFRLLCGVIGVTEIAAVADAARVHHAAYFGPAAEAKLCTAYDTVWAERGGTRRDGESFLLPVEARRRPLEEIPSKKRASYRRRGERLDALRAALVAACQMAAAPGA